MFAFIGQNSSGEFLPQLIMEVVLNEHLAYS